MALKSVRFHKYSILLRIDNLKNEEAKGYKYSNDISLKNLSFKNQVKFKKHTFQVIAATKTCRYIMNSWAFDCFYAYEMFVQHSATFFNANTTFYDIQAAENLNDYFLLMSYSISQNWKEI